MLATTQNCTVFLNASSGLSSKEGMLERLQEIFSAGGVDVKIEQCEKGRDIGHWRAMPWPKALRW